MGSSDWIAIYAAVVASGALLLEIRRWFESGPRVVVRATANMMMVGGGTDEEESGLLVVNVSNRGTQPTTITHMVLYEYGTWSSRLRGRQTKSFLVPNPQPLGARPILPAELKPGGQWMGIGRDRSEVTGDIETGSFWAGVVTTDRERPYLQRIKRRREAVPKDAKSI